MVQAERWFFFLLYCDDCAIHVRSVSTAGISSILRLIDADSHRIIL